MLTESGIWHLLRLEVTILMGLALYKKVTLQKHIIFPRMILNVIMGESQRYLLSSENLSYYERLCGHSQQNSRVKWTKSVATTRVQ